MGTRHLPALTLALSLTGSAAAVAEPADDFLRDCACRPVAEAALDGLRGGFDDGRGLIASIGLERLTTVNGAVVSTVNLQIADLSRATAQQLRQLQSTLAAVGIANGGGDLAHSLQGLPAGTTLIQNSLSNQSIRNATVLNISTNSQQLMKAANLQATLQDALAQPLSAR